MKWYERYLDNQGLDLYVSGLSQGHRILLSDLVWIDPPFDTNDRLEQSWARDNWWRKQLTKGQSRWAVVQADEGGTMVYFLTGSCVRKQRLFKTESAAVKDLQKKGFQPFTSSDLSECEFPQPPYYRPSGWSV